MAECGSDWRSIALTAMSAFKTSRVIHPTMADELGSILITLSMTAKSRDMTRSDRVGLYEFGAAMVEVLGI